MCIRDSPNNVRINMNPSRGDNAVKTTTETRRIKELDTVKVPKFPTLPSLPAWKLAIGKNLVAASGRNDMREIYWWAETSKETSTFDSLEDSGEDRFLSLDLKLSISLSVMLKEVNNEVTSSTAQKEHAASMKGRMLKGRQIAWLILTFFKRHKNGCALKRHRPGEARLDGRQTNAQVLEAVATNA